MIERLIKREGYMCTREPHDTVNIVCHRGHVYEDNGKYMAAFDNATRSERVRMVQLGQLVADGDFGELTFAFGPDQLKDVMRIMRPRYGVLAAA